MIHRVPTRGPKQRTPGSPLDAGIGGLEFDSKRGTAEKTRLKELPVGFEADERTDPAASGSLSAKRPVDYGRADS